MGALGTRPEKPLKRRNYGSIGHLPGSNTGPADHTINDGQFHILCFKPRKGDLIIVREKLDGTNVGVAKVDGKIVALQRKGYPCDTSPHEQHHLFADYVRCREKSFDAALDEGERIVGEWLAQAHGTRYRIKGDRFFAFDIFSPDNIRWPDSAVEDRCHSYGIQMPACLWKANASLSIDSAMRKLGPFGHHDAIDLAEGAVWRAESEDHGTDILAKYVRPEKIAGLYLPETIKEPVWNI